MANRLANVFFAIGYALLTSACSTTIPMEQHKLRVAYFYNRSGLLNERETFSLISTALKNVTEELYRHVEVRLAPREMRLSDGVLPEITERKHEADLVVYVSADASSCRFKEVAFASPAQFDTCGRTIAGYLTMCPQYNSSWSTPRSIYSTLMHEMYHLLAPDDLRVLGSYRVDSQLAVIDSPVTSVKTRADYCPYSRGILASEAHIYEMPVALMSPIEKSDSYLTNVSIAMLNDAGHYSVSFDMAEMPTQPVDRNCSLLELAQRYLTHDFINIYRNDSHTFQFEFALGVWQKLKLNIFVSPSTGLKRLLYSSQWFNYYLDQNNTIQLTEEQDQEWLVEMSRLPTNISDMEFQVRFDPLRLVMTDQLTVIELPTYRNADLYYKGTLKVSIDGRIVKADFVNYPGEIGFIDVQVKAENVSGDKYRSTGILPYHLDFDGYVIPTGPKAQSYYDLLGFDLRITINNGSHELQAVKRRPDIMAIQYQVSGTNFSFFVNTLPHIDQSHFVSIEKEKSETVVTPYYVDTDNILHMKAISNSSFYFTANMSQLLLRVYTLEIPKNSTLLAGHTNFGDNSRVIQVSEGNTSSVRDLIV